MRTIAILHSGDLRNISIGGISQYIQDVIKNETDYRIILYGTCEAESYTLGKHYERLVDNVPYTFVPLTNDKKKPLSIYYFFEMGKYLKEIEKCDVIYCQRMEYVLPFAGRKDRHKVVMAVHGSGAYTTMWRGALVARVYNILERLAVNTAMKVIVLQKREEFGVPYYKKRYAKNANKIYYGRVPIDIELFRVHLDVKNRKKTNKIIKILYIGRLDDNPKRVLLFPEIASHLVEEQIPYQFVVIGDGTSKKELEKKLEDMHVKDSFSLLGKLEHDESLVRAINECDVALIISTFEGICMSALECIACGVPVIATDVGDIKEYINNGENGIIIPNDSNVVVNVVTSINKIVIEGCSTNNVYEEFNVSKMILELNSIFEEL